jgi:hypothetical protein
MIDQLIKWRRKQMTKNGNIGGTVEVPTKDDLDIKEVDLTKRYKDWDDGFTVPDDKTKDDKDE